LPQASFFPSHKKHFSEIDALCSCSHSASKLGRKRGAEKSAAGAFCPNDTKCFLLWGEAGGAEKPEPFTLARYAKMHSSAIAQQDNILYSFGKPCAFAVSLRQAKTKRAPEQVGTLFL